MPRFSSFVAVYGKFGFSVLTAYVLSQFRFVWFGIRWFDNHCLFGPIGHIPPVEAEANYYASVEALDIVA